MALKFMTLASPAAMLLTGCLATVGPTTSVTAVMPAAFSEAARIREVAVLPFDGPSGREFAAEVEGLLASVTVDDKPHFRVAERQKLDGLLREIKLSQSGRVTGEEALRLGKLLGVRALYTGVVSAPVTNRTHTQEPRTVCVEEDTKKGFLGVPKCKRWDQTRVSCSRTEVIYAFTPKLIEVESGQIVFSNNIKGVASASSCADRSAAMPSQAQLIAAAKTSALDDFRKQVAPSIANVNIRLMDSAEGIGDESAKRKLAQGVEFAKANRLDRACEFWNEADQLSARSVSIVYNLAVCAETAGNIPKAAELYRRADRLLNSPDDRVSAALARVEKTRTDAAKLDRQVN